MFAVAGSNPAVAPSKKNVGGRGRSVLVKISRNRMIILAKDVP